METTGRSFGKIFDGLLLVFGGLPPAASLTVISLLLGVLMLFAFKWLGNPEALETSRRRMQAHLMEMRLFDREPKIVIKALRDLLWWNLRFFVASLRPALVATAPMVLLFVQMEHYYGVRPLQPGESAVVTATLQPSAEAPDTVELHASNGLRVATRPVRVPRLSQVSWRIEAEKPGDHRILLEVDGERVTKTVTVGEAPTRVSMRRVVRGDQAFWLYPIEEPFESSKVRFLEVRYPTTEVSIAGLRTHWLVWLVLISVVGAFAIRAAVNTRRPGLL